MNVLSRNHLTWSFAGNLSQVNSPMVLGFQQILFFTWIFFWLPNKANEIGASLGGDGDCMEEMDTPLGFWGPCGGDRDPHEGQGDPMGEMETPLGR